MASFSLGAFSSFGSFGVPQSVSVQSSSEILTATSPANYALCWEIMTDQSFGEVIRCSAYSYAISGK